MSTSRVIIKNLLSLSVAEAANKGILFLSTIYLARIILPEGLGIISFANSLLVFFTIVVNLGLNTVGARDIASDQSSIKKYASQITVFRFLLAIISSMLLIGLALFIDKPLTVKLVIIISSLNLFALSFQMDWVYQGIEKMEFLALRQLITSLLSLIGLIIFVKSFDDVITAMIITSASALINSFWMLLLFLKMYGGLSFKPDFTFIKSLLKSSLPITLSTFFITLYNFLSFLMIGFLKTDTETGLYKAAFSFVTLVLTLSVIIQNTFFPVLSRASTVEDKERIFRIYSNFMLIVGAMGTMIVFVSSDFVIFTAYGNKYIDSVPLLNILMITTLLMFINTIFYPALLSWKEEKVAMYAIITGGIINIILNVLLIPTFGSTGAAWASVASEFGVLVGLFIIMQRKVNQLFVPTKLLIIAIAVLSGYCGLLTKSQLLFHPLLASTVSLFILIALILIFRIININEIKGYLRK